MRVPRWHWRYPLAVATAALVVGCALFGGGRPLEEAIERMPRTGRSVRLVVNGEEIPSAAVDRATVYFFGRAYLERRIRDFLVADEIELRRKSGQAVDDLQIAEAEVLETVASRKEQLQEQSQWSKDLNAVLRAQGMDITSLAEEVASGLRFDKVFLPEDSTKWSETTREALASQGEQDFVDWTLFGLPARRGETLTSEGGRRSVEKARTGRTQGVETLASEEFQDKELQALVDREIKALREPARRQPNAPIPPFYRTVFREWITKVLKEASNIQTASDGLPPDVVLTVNGRRLLTAEAFPTVARRVTAIDREQVLRWMAWATATRQALVKAGVYLPEEEFAKKWQAHVGPYEKTPFSIEVVATAFKRFPSYDLYREYCRLRKSFEKMIEKEVTEEALLQHRARVQDFLGDGKVDAQVILLSAFDPIDFNWKGPDAFDKAKARAEEVMAALEAGTSFDEAIDRYSEFIDLPVRTPLGKPYSDYPHRNHGRFGPQSKNQLRQFLGETEFDELVRGTSIGEILFHEATLLEVVGPMRGPHGWYIGRVLERLPGAKTGDFAQETTRNLLREDYLTRRFIDWSAGVVARSRFKIR